MFFSNSQWQGCPGSGSLTSGYLCQSVVLAANGNPVEVNEVGLVPAYTCVSVPWKGFCFPSSVFVGARSWGYEGEL